MKKLLKKKVNVFGKGVPVLAIFVLGIALVSAALVPYLSGVITGLVTADSPMKMEIHDGTNWIEDGTIDLGTIYGGGEKTLELRVTNLATDKSITGIVNNVVTAPVVDTIEMSCADFESVLATTVSTFQVAPTGQKLTELQGDPNCQVDATGLIWTCGSYDLIDLLLCDDSGTDTAVFSYGPNPIVWAPGQEDVTTIVATFKLHAVGNYVFTSQVV